jgi:hypothetical protein
MYIGRAIVTCNNASPRIIGTVKLIFMNIEIGQDRWSLNKGLIKMKCTVKGN